MYGDSLCSFLPKGPEEAGSGRYGSRYTIDMGVDEDDDGFEDYLDLDVSFEEVTKSLLVKPGCS